MEFVFLPVRSDGRCVRDIPGDALRDFLLQKVACCIITKESATRQMPQERAATSVAVPTMAAFGIFIARTLYAGTGA